MFVVAERAAAPVALLGPTVAIELGIASAANRPALRIGGTTFIVVGILDGVRRHPELLNAVIIPTATASRLWGDPSGDIQGLFVALAGICLVVGMVGIANTTFVTVVERTGEIGLRRALGARRTHIAAPFLTEAATIGLLGGLIGTYLGIGAVLLVAVSNGWTAVVPAGLAIAGPGIGLLTALVTAAYPALRGARIEPTVALRGTT